jgi:hypothetical protein
MEGQRKVHVWELVLRVTIGRVCDDPPTTLNSVLIPQVMAVIEDVFCINFLTEFHRQVRSLSVHVAKYFIGFFLRCFKHIYLK